jgi:hypothetical protein
MPYYIAAHPSQIFALAVSKFRRILRLLEVEGNMKSILTSLAAANPGVD